MLADPRYHVRVNELTAPEFSNASGDFLLLTRATWRRLRGFNETVRHAKIHKDAQFCHRAWIEGLSFDTLGPIWHLDHDGSYSNAGVLRGSPDAPYGPEWEWRADYRNPDDGDSSAPSRRRTNVGFCASATTSSSGRETSSGVRTSLTSMLAAAGRALLSALGAAPAAVAAWLAAIGLRDGARLAIGGPDWATPFLRRRPGPPGTSSSASTRPMRVSSARSGAAR